jgi:hypothetical protein
MIPVSTCAARSVIAVESGRLFVAGARPLSFAVRERVNAPVAQRWRTMTGTTAP